MCPPTWKEALLTQQGFPGGSGCSLVTPCHFSATSHEVVRDRTPLIPCSPMGQEGANSRALAPMAIRVQARGGGSCHHGPNTQNST